MCPEGGGGGSVASCRFCLPDPQFPRDSAPLPDQTQAPLPGPGWLGRAVEPPQASAFQNVALEPLYLI